MFCDTRYLLHWIAISICRRARTARLPFQRQVRAVSFGPTNYEECLHRSEWVSDTFAYRSPHNKLCFNASGYHSFKKVCLFYLLLHILFLLNTYQFVCMWSLISIADLFIILQELMLLFLAISLFVKVTLLFYCLKSCVFYLSFLFPSICNQSIPINLSIGIDNRQPHKSSPLIGHRLSISIN